MPSARSFFTRSIFVTCACWGITSTALAAEGFKVRYPTAGALGPELAVFNVESNTYGSIAVNSTTVTQINGNDGKQAWTPPAVGAKVQTALADFQQHQTVANLLLGYVSPPQYAGGHLAVAFNLPYTINVSRTLNFPVVSATVPGTGAATTPGAAYLANLAAQSSANDVSTKGLGDADLTAAWIKVDGKLKTSFGLSLVLPTGDFNSLPTGAAGSPAINIGFGHFYTLRPAATVAYQLNDEVTLGARGALGINTRDTVDDWRSGNFAALDLAAAYRTQVGVVGAQLITVRQYQDDTGGQSGNQAGGYGDNRYGSMGLGVFFTTRVSSWGVNAGYTQTIRATNALVSKTFQVRATHAF